MPIFSYFQIIFSNYQFFFQIVMTCFEAFDAMCRKIVCPTRHEIEENQMIERKFRSNNVKYEYLNVKNKQNHKLSVIVFAKNFDRYPTILYLHGNGGHKLESLQIANQKVNLIAFDFSGCGKSEGQFITYGDKEVQDIFCVVDQIKFKFHLKKIVIWGRSMGASLAIQFASKYPENVLCLILDTPFRLLRKVVHNVASQNQRAIPNFLIEIGIYLVGKKTQNIVGTDIFQHDFSTYLQSIKVPILFTFSTRDTVVKEQDVKQLFDIFKGQKDIFKIDSLHHQDRPKNFIQFACNFIQISFRPQNSDKQNHKNANLFKFDQNKRIRNQHSNILYQI